MQTPDIRTISDFRQRHLPALGELLVEVLRLCREAGLVTLWHVALDETKVKSQRLQAQGHELHADEEGRIGTGAIVRG